MGMIRAYGDLPRMYRPDVGEVVEARRSVACGFVRAVVLHVRRRGADALEVKVQWLGSDPDGWIPRVTMAGVHSREPAPIIEGAVGWIDDRRVEGAPLLIRRVDRGAGG